MTGSEELLGEIARLEARQAKMRLINKTLKRLKGRGKGARIQALLALGVRREQAEGLLDFSNQRVIGYGTWAFEHNADQIRRAYKRLRERKKLERIYNAT